MRGVNKVILIGTLGRDPESKSFSNGGSICNFSIATSESWTDKNTGQKVENTEWHRISASNRLGEVAQQYLRKGSKVYIEGSLRTRKWTDKDGQERYATEIRAESLQMLDSAKSNGQNSNSGHSGADSGDYQPYQKSTYQEPAKGATSDNGYTYNAGYGNPNQSKGQNGAPQYNTDLDDDLPF